MQNLHPVPWASPDCHVTKQGHNLVPPAERKPETQLTGG